MNKFDISVDKSSRYPVYLQIADQIRRQISDGELNENEVFPDERSLSSRLGINRLTLRRSFKILESEGLIYKIRGSGVFVGRTRTESPLTRFESGYRSITAIVMPESLENHYAHTMRRGAIAHLTASNRHVVVVGYINADEQRSHLARYQDVLSGVIFFCSQTVYPETGIQYAKSLSLPWVLMGGADVVGEGIPAVGVDNRNAAETATSYFISKKHRWITMITRPFGSGAPSPRVEGYLEAMIAVNLRPDVVDGEKHSNVSVIKEKDVNLVSHGYLSGRELIKTKQTPTAVLCEHDLIAVGVHNALSEEGVDVPGQIEIIGFGDDSEMRSFYGGGDCPISTVAFPREEEGRAAAELLLETVEKPDMDPRTIYLPTTIIHRQTTK